jgi:hypothetical protein
MLISEITYELGEPGTLTRMTVAPPEPNDAYESREAIRTNGRIESAGDQVAGGISQIEHVHDGGWMARAAPTSP